MPKRSRQRDAVLDALYEDEPPHYGLEIMRLTGLRSGTVYPILARLEREGVVESWWEDDASAQGRPRRRYYRAT